MSPSIDMRENREFASELKFLIRPVLAEIIRDWARARIPDGVRTLVELPLWVLDAYCGLRFRWRLWFRAWRVLPLRVNGMGGLFPRDAFPRRGRVG